MTFNYDALNMNLEVILPELIVTGFAILVIFMDLFMRGKDSKNNALAMTTIAGYVVAMVVSILYYYQIIETSSFNTEAFGRMVVMDGSN